MHVNGIILVVVAALILLPVNGYKILIYSPGVSRSHMMSNTRIAEALSKGGHNVSLLVPEYDLTSSSVRSAENVVQIRLSNFSSEKYDKMAAHLMNNIYAPDEGILGSLFRPDHRIFDLLIDYCDDMLERYKDFLMSLQDEHYDIFMTEHVDTCGPALKHLVKARSLIWIASSPIAEFMTTVIGVSTPTSFVPSAESMFPDVSDNMTMYQRLRNTIEHYYYYKVIERSIERTDATFRKHIDPNYPSVRTVLQDVALIFVLADEFLSFPRPILHNMVYIGGGGMDITKQKLPERYAMEMQKGKKGVVFFSFGSIIRSSDMPYSLKQHLIDAFASLPDYHFIVKTDENDVEIADLAASASNIKLVQWVPQGAILGHERLKLFITHGGYNSLLEVVQAGKPILCMPSFADQWITGRLAERNGFGRVFDKRDLVNSPTEFRKLLLETLEDSTLEQHVRRIHALIKSKPVSPTERLLKYTEFVGEHGSLPELHVSGRKLSTIVYYNLDLLALIGCGLVLSSVLFIAILVSLTRWLWHQTLNITPFKSKKID